MTLWCSLVVVRCITQQGAIARRFASSSATRRGPSHAGVRAVPFAITEPAARSAFAGWWARATPSLTPPPLTSVAPLYAPHWVFRYSLRVPSLGLRRSTDESDTPLSIVYAGAKHPRESMAVVKSRLHAAVPFRDDLLSSSCEVEGFALYESTAWTLVRDAVLSAEAAQLEGSLAGPAPILDDAVWGSVQSYRVLFPCWQLTYNYLGVTFTVLVNGASGEVWGLQQEAFFGGLSMADVFAKASRLAPLARWLTSLQLSPQSISVILSVIASVLRPATKLLLYPPFAAATLAGVLGIAAFRITGTLRSEWVRNLSWRATVAAEAAAQRGLHDEWVFRQPEKEEEAPRGAGEAHKRREAERAAEAASAPPKRAPPGRGWKPRLPPEVNEGDYFAVLGLQPGASEEAIKSAGASAVVNFLKCAEQVLRVQISLTLCTPLISTGVVSPATGAGSWPYRPRLRLPPPVARHKQRPRGGEKRTGAASAGLGGGRGEEVVRKCRVTNLVRPLNPETYEGFAPGFLPVGLAHGAGGADVLGVVRQLVTAPREVAPAVCHVLHLGQRVPGAPARGGAGQGVAEVGPRRAARARAGVHEVALFVLAHPAGWRVGHALLRLAARRSHGGALGAPLRAAPLVHHVGPVLFGVRAAVQRGVVEVFGVVCLLLALGCLARAHLERCAGGRGEGGRG